MTTRGKVITAALITVGVTVALTMVVRAELAPIPGPQTHKQRRRMNRPSYYMRRQRT